MTWKDFQVMVIAEGRREIRDWRRTRAILHLLYAANTTDKVKLKPEQLLPLPGDEIIKPARPTQEQILQTIQLYGIGNKK